MGFEACDLVGVIVAPSSRRPDLPDRLSVLAVNPQHSQRRLPRGPLIRFFCNIANSDPIFPKVLSLHDLYLGMISGSDILPIRSSRSLPGPIPRPREISSLRRSPSLDPKESIPASQGSLIDDVQIPPSGHLTESPHHHSRHRGYQPQCNALCSSVPSGRPTGS